MYGKRYYIMKELVTTEFMYVRDLQTLIKVFLEPLRSGHVLSDNDIYAIFSNVETIQTINKELYSSLQQHWVMTQRLEDHTEMGKVEIGAVFLDLADYLKMYTTYINNHASSLEKHVQCRKKFRDYNKFITDAESKDECAGLQFKDFLIKPIQRLCKYPLLFRELVENTPHDHPDHGDIKKTYEKVSEVAAHVDRLNKQLELVKKLEDFDETVTGFGEKLVSSVMHRQYVKDGWLDVMQDGDLEYEKRHVYVFSDVFIFTKEKKKKLEKFMFQVPISEIRDIKASRHDSTNCCWTIYLNVSEKISINTNNKGVRDVWVTECRALLTLPTGSGRHTPKKSRPRTNSKAGGTMDRGRKKRPRLEYRNTISDDEQSIETLTIEDKIENMKAKIQKLHDENDQKEQKLEALQEVLIRLKPHLSELLTLEIN